MTDDHIALKALFIFLLAISCYSCGNQPALPQWKISQRMTRMLQLTNTFSSDTCLIILSPHGDSLVFDREIYIEENTFEDTLNVGFTILPPAQTGSMVILQNGLAVDKSLDPKYYEDDKAYDPEIAKTNVLCVYKYSGKGINRNDREQVLKIRIKPL